MKRYWQIFKQLLLFHLQSKMTYRLNFLLESIHWPVYMIVMYLLVKLSFSRAGGSIFGLSETEGILLFGIFNMTFALCFATIISGLQHFVWAGVRTGELDQVLTKPISPKFFIAFSLPDASSFIFFLVSLGIVINQTWLLKSQITFFNLFSFLITYLLSLLLIYYVLLLYASASLYVVKAQQVFELFNKMSDFGQFSPKLFPFSIQILLVTILPLTLFAYLPTQVLLGRASWTDFPLLIGIIIITKFFADYSWREGLKRYSSASS